MQACGDAHLANFGLYASPERKLVFDINDFDETLEGPWEWDLKRLVASFTIAARHNELDRDESRKVTERVVQSYREAMQRLRRKCDTTDIWYALIDETRLRGVRGSRTHTKSERRKTIAKAKTKHSLQALDRLAEEVDGKYRIKSEPPLLVPLRKLEPEPQVDRREIDQGKLRSLHAKCFAGLQGAPEEISAGRLWPEGGWRRERRYAVLDPAAGGSGPE